MKPIIALIVISLISLSLTVSLDRVKRSKSQSKTKSKSEGSGDYNTGFVIPGFLVAKGKDAFNSDKILGANAKFKPLALENPTTDDDKLGWCFEMEDPKEELAKIMVKGKVAKFWCIPFRWFTSVMEFTNPFGDYKSLTGWVVNDEKESYKVKVLLPYKTVGWYITDDEANKCSGNINVNRMKQQGSVKNGKSAVNSAAVSLTTNAPLLKSATDGAEKLKAEQTKLKTDLETLKKETEAKEATFNKNAGAITESEVKLNEIKTAQDTLSREISTIGSKIENIQQALSLAEANTTPEQLKAKYDVVVKKNTEDLKAAITTLKGLAPPRSADLDTAEKAVVEKSDLAVLGTNLSKVAPA